ncbi:MAG: class I SAM-dependent methyltransferase, partial [Myxococcota bacterium]
GSPSFTAEGAAAVRALETLRAARFRVFEDPFARAFLTLRTRWRLWPGVRPLVERMIDRTLPGVLPFTAARSRWMDELLLEIAPEVDQIVLLGAGYDTAFARHPEIPARLAYFEVDHPATGAAKKARIARRPDLFGAAFEKVRTVPVDFEREDLLARLTARGFAPDKKTLYVLSGVLPYLGRPAIEATLAVIARTAPGSHLMADLVSSSGMREPRSSRSLRYFRKLGEAIRFMIDPDDLKAMLEPFGIHVVSIRGGKALHALYFAPDDPRRLSEYAYLLHARVGPA